MLTQLWSSCRFAVVPAQSRARGGRVSALLVAGFLAAAALPMTAQVRSATASRAADLQVGGYFSYATKSDDPGETFSGGGGYVVYDFRHNFGVEGNFHQVNGPATSYERTYEVGARYVQHYGRFDPYVRVSIGRGVFNFENDIANLAYNMGAIGGGVDIHIVKHVNVRADYDFQAWKDFQGGYLSPQIASFGAAYHF